MSTSQEGSIPDLGEDKGEEKVENTEKMKRKVVEETEDRFSDFDSEYSYKSSTKTFTKIPFNYEHLNSSSFQGTSMNLGEPPHFDGMGYTSWRHKMRVHLIGVNLALWKIVCVGLNIPDED